MTPHSGLHPAETGRKPLGAIIARGVDRSTIEQITTRDPLVANGVARYTITTITPGRVHPGFADILKPES